jgi:hypothetical protein
LEGADLELFGFCYHYFYVAMYLVFTLIIIFICREMVCLRLLYFELGTIFHFFSLD